MNYKISIKTKHLLFEIYALKAVEIRNILLFSYDKSVFNTFLFCGKLFYIDYRFSKVLTRLKQEKLNETLYKYEIYEKFCLETRQFLKCMILYQVAYD